MNAPATGAGNVLLITLDQFRGDCLSAAGHPHVRTPNLDALAATGVRFARHYSQTAPCGPSRASILTGMYAMNHRSVANGTPLDDRFTNIAREVRRAGYAPALFGYSDTTIDPRVIARPDDHRLFDWESPLPGFDPVVDMTESLGPWGRWLSSLGYDVPAEVGQMYVPEGDRWGPVRYRAEHSDTAFLASEVLGWVGRQERPWFAHASFIRPHPPFVAPAPYHVMFEPGDMADPIPADHGLHPTLDGWLAQAGVRASSNPETVRRVKAMYFGMIAEVDDQMGRLFDGLRELGAWDDTLVIVTSDHGEQLGDHGLAGKLGFYDQSFHIPCIVRDPRPSADASRSATVGAYTENVDLVPTMLDWLGLDIPLQCDGSSLGPFLSGEPRPIGWREGAHHEFDWRYWPRAPGRGSSGWPADRSMDAKCLSVLRDERGTYVQFGDGTALFFDRTADPEERASDLTHPDAFRFARRMLSWRLRNADRVLAGAFTDREGLRGRLPPLPWEPLIGKTLTGKPLTR